MWGGGGGERGRGGAIKGDLKPERTRKPQTGTPSFMSVQNSSLSSLILIQYPLHITDRPAQGLRISSVDWSSPKTLN